MTRNHSPHRLERDELAYMSSDAVPSMRITPLRAPWTVDDYAEAIAAEWRKTLLGIIGTGKLLIAAKEALGHGAFLRLFTNTGDGKVPFTSSTAQRLMAIARNEVLSNAAHVQHLPPSWGVLYELSKCEQRNLREYIRRGLVTADMERREAIALARQAKYLAQGIGAFGQPKLPPGQYRVLYADVPWQYNNSSQNAYGHSEWHYPTLSLEEICDYSDGTRCVRDLAAHDSVLFLWVTVPMLEKGLQVINAWGFSYKTHFVWNKVRHNFGNYSSVRHECLFLATQGSCTPDRAEKCGSVIVHERSHKHSEKPALFRELIDRLYFPRDPVDRIELFNRGGAPSHWHTFGNESP